MSDSSRSNEGSAVPRGALALYASLITGRLFANLWPAEIDFLPTGVHPVVEGVVEVVR